jgi:hypothetical protein
MIGSEITIRLEPQSMRVLRELTEAMNRQHIEVPSPMEQPRLPRHVHCGRCGCEAYLNTLKPYEERYRCGGCGCIGTRDDRGSCGAIRWG